MILIGNPSYLILIFWKIMYEVNSVLLKVYTCIVYNVYSLQFIHMMTCLYIYHLGSILVIKFSKEFETEMSHTLVAYLKGLEEENFLFWQVHQDSLCIQLQFYNYWYQLILPIFKYSLLIPWFTKKIYLIGCRRANVFGLVIYACSVS